MKQADWPVVAALTRKSPSSLAENSGIRELDLDGRITDQHFAQAGFGPNIVVVKKEKETDSGTPSPYTIATCSGQEVTLVMVGGDGTKTLEVTRAQLISCWAVKKQTLTEVSPCITNISIFIIVAMITKLVVCFQFKCRSTSTDRTPTPRKGSTS